LGSPEAGGKVIRGGSIRAFGYAINVVLGLAISVLLLRYLGVEDFGRFVTVTALLGIVAGVTDAGLTAAGTRELALLRRGEERNHLLSGLLSLRLITTAIGVAIAVGFAALVGYDNTMVAGTLLVGLAVVIISLQSMTTLSLYVDLRFGLLTLLEVLRPLLSLIAVALTVAVGAALLSFFSLQIGVGIVMLTTTIILTRVTVGLRFTRGVDYASLRRLLREVLPISIAMTMSVVYFGALVIIVSLVGTETDTGLYGASFRAFEVVVGLPILVLNAALPLLSVAGRDDEQRLGLGAQRMVEVGLLMAGLLALLIGILATSVVVLAGGSEFEDAGPLLALMGLALLPLFLSQTIQLMLISLRLHRALIVANAAALVVVIALGVTLVAAYGATGAAVAVVLGEVVLASLLFGMLMRARPGLVPDLRFVWKVVVAAGGASLVLVLPGLSPWVAAVIAAIIYTVIAFAIRAVPPEATDALLPNAISRRLPTARSIASDGVE